MKKILLSFIIIAAASVSCTVTNPLMTSSNANPTKVGKSKAVYVFGIPLKNKNGISHAVRNGNITHICYVDKKTTYFIPFYLKTETYVYGN